MTNEECIKMLKSKLDGNTDTSYEWCECVRLAIKALESQACEDCISREEAVEVIAGTDETNGNEPVFSGKQIIKMLKDLPPVTPKPKTGHWIKLEPYPLQMHEYKCSECGNETDNNTESYCSECGAKMTESEDKG